MDDAPQMPPTRFSAGDALWFELYYPDYLPVDGWAMEVVLTNLAGINQATVQSTADGDRHLIQSPAFAAGLDAGDYYLSVFAVNAGKNFRHRIYYFPFKLSPDLADGTASKPIATFAEEMLCSIEKQLKYMASHVLTMSEEQRTHYEMVTRPDLMKQWREFREVRANEIRMERARNGQSPGNTIRPVFMIPS